MRKTAKHKTVWQQKCHIYGCSSTNTQCLHNFNLTEVKLFQHTAAAACCIGPHFQIMYSLCHSETTNCCLWSENETSAHNFSKQEQLAHYWRQARGQYTTLLTIHPTSISFTVQFGAFCFTSLQSFMSRPCQHTGPHIPCLNSILKKFTPSFQKLMKVWAIKAR